MNTPDAKAGVGLVGVGAAACAACCAGPILGFLAATGIASVLGAVIFGAVGLVTVVVELVEAPQLKALHAAAAALAIRQAIAPDAQGRLPEPSTP
jgi:hypothetical protein